MRKSSRRNGFTLIEVSVVIGIIAMLAALIMPALSRAREQGRRTQCLNNLGQIGKALAIYSNGYNEYLPSHAGWGLNGYRLRHDGMTLDVFAGHQGLSRHMTAGYGAAESDPSALEAGRLNFAPVGIGLLVARNDLSVPTLVCPSMQGRVRTFFGAAEYYYEAALPKLLRQTPGRPIYTSDGRLLHHADAGAGATVTAILSSYSYRNTPFYNRSTPDNAPPGWTYVGDYPSLYDTGAPGQPWVAEWALEGTAPMLKAQFMCPPFKTMRALGARAIVADTFDNAPKESGGVFGIGLGAFHHRDGYNVLHGDGRVAWFNDDEDVVLKWKHWPAGGDAATNNLTISSPASHAVWSLFDRANANP